MLSGPLDASQGPRVTAITLHQPDGTGGALPSGQHELHGLDHALVWPTRSNLQLTTRSGSHVVVSPDAIWLPARTSFRVHADVPWCVARFGADSCPRTWNRFDVLDLDGVVGPMLEHVARRPNDVVTPHLLSAVATHLSEAFSTRQPSLPFPRDPRARDVAELLAADPASTLELSDLAPKVGASERTLRRLFLDETGLAFGAWRRRLRAHRAMRLLGGASPVGDVARRCGYASTAAFTRAFSREIGTTPLDYVRLLDERRERDWPARSTEWPSGREEAGQPDPIRVDGLTGDEMARLMRTLAVIGAAALLTGACGSDDDSSDGAGDAAASTTTRPSTEEHASASAPTDDGASTSAPSTEEQAPTSALADDGDEAGAASAYPREVEHVGGVLTLEERPERVYAVRNGDSFDVPAALGAAPVAFGSFPRRPLYTWQEEIGADSVLVDVTDGLPLETIAQLDIDLVIAPAGFVDFAPDDIDALSQIAPVLVIPDASIDDWPEQLRIVGDALGVDQAIIDDAQVDIDQVFDVSLPAVESLAALTNFGVPALLVDGSRANELVEALALPTLFGAEELAASTVLRPGVVEISEEIYPEITAEVLLAVPPDAGSNAVEVIEGSPLFESIPAVAAGNYAALDDTFSRALLAPTVLNAPLAVEQIVSAIGRALGSLG